MSFKQYIKEKLPVLLANVAIFVFVAYLMFLYNINRNFIFLIAAIWLLPVVTFILADYLKKRKFYFTLISKMEALDKKHLISEIIDEPDFLEGQVLYDILKDAGKSMQENINKYRYLQQEYREYIEAWVHEIKTPIASSKLVIENNKTEITLSIMEELVKIEEFIDQALYYSRSNTTEEDYIVKAFSLKTAVNEVIKKNMHYFIQKRIQLFIDDNCDITVFSDIKWVTFILNQIIVNAINYSRVENPIIKVYIKKNSNSISLYIEDNGIGITEKDIAMVFNKGFTGENGRKYKKSTGMGLYLCRKLCNKLGLEIGISSELGQRTVVTINFPESGMILLE